MIKLTTFFLMIAIIFSTIPGYAQDGSKGIGNKTVSQLPSKDKRWALIIGVDNYQDDNISDLRGASNDAKVLAESLEKYAGFPSDQIILLTTSSSNQKQPTRASILRYFSNLKTLVPKDGLLLVSFSGHGIERNNRAFLIPSDTTSTDDVDLLEETALSVDSLKRQIRATQVQQVLFLLDACRNDPTSGRSESTNALTEAYKRGFSFDVANKEVEAFATIYATSVGARAYEYVEKQQGYFSWAIVEALSGKAANSNGEVTLGSLVKYVEARVPKMVQIDLGSAKIQRPFANIEGYKADELVLSIGGSVQPVPSPRPYPTDIGKSSEDILWDDIEKSKTIRDYESYLQTFPNGKYVELAKRRINSAKSAIWEEKLKIENELWTKYYNLYYEPRKNTGERPAGLEVKQALCCGVPKQTKKLSEMVKQGYKLPLDFYDLAIKYKELELVEMPKVTEHYLFDQRGLSNADNQFRQGGFTTFNWEERSKPLLQSSPKFQLLKDLAEDFGGASYNLENPIDREQMKQRMLRLMNPRAKKVIEDISKLFYQKFKRPLMITSGIRSMEYQISLNANNPNSFQVRGNGSLPPHTSGVAFDIERKYLTVTEQNFLINEITNMEERGLLDGLIEYNENAVFHIFVYPDGRPPDLENIEGNEENTNNEEDTTDLTLTQLTELIEKSPDTANYYLARGKLYADENSEFEKAIADFTKAIALDVTQAEYYFQRAEAYSNSELVDKLELALADYNIAIEVGEDDGRYYSSRANVYVEMKNFDAAMKDYNKAIELDNTAFNYYYRANAFVIMKKFDLALKDFSKAIELYPKGDLMWHSRGSFYLEQKQYEKALSDFNKAIELDPSYKLSYRKRAEVYDALGKKALADADRKKVAELEKK